MATVMMYRGLDNPWPVGSPVGNFIESRDYVRTATTIRILPKVRAGLYITSNSKIRVVDYARIPLHYSGAQVCSKYPHLRAWIKSQWPRSVGRYTVHTDDTPSYTPDTRPRMVIDLVFGKACDDPESLRSTPCNPRWSPAEVKEWTSGNHGYWTGWTYDLQSAPMSSVIMALIEEIPQHDRTPHRVVRHITSCASSENRDDALMVGKWTKGYTDGRAPHEWGNSHEIYENRHHSGLPAKYAQCWVFTEVLTSAFRFLGIPSRSVYVANAHIDKGRDNGIDIGAAMCKGDDGEQMEVIVPPLEVHDTILDITSSTLGTFIAQPFESVIDKGNCSSGEVSPPTTPTYHMNLKDFVSDDDSVWNFHFWNETYMNRPDTRQPFDIYAWQCSDASPMLVTDSDDTYAGKKLFGPCSTIALQEGVNTDHDFRYMYSAVNSPFRFWKQDTLVASDGTATKVSFVANITYNVFDRAVCKGKKVEVFTRDPHTSVDDLVIARDITSSYIPESPDKALRIHHADHPAVFSWSNGSPSNGNSTSLVCQARHHVEARYYVQICYLTPKGQLLMCDRQSVGCVSHVVIPQHPGGTGKASIFIAHLTGGEIVNVSELRKPTWWVSVVS